MNESLVGFIHYLAAYPEITKVFILYGLYWPLLVLFNVLIDRGIELRGLVYTTFFMLAASVLIVAIHNPILEFAGMMILSHKSVKLAYILVPQRNYIFRKQTSNNLKPTKEIFQEKK